MKNPEHRPALTDLELSNVSLKSVRSFPNDTSACPGFTPVAALENMYPVLAEMGLYPTK
jgi:hypothetical protein